MDIVSMHKAGVSISAIARELGISRNTVKATLRRDGPPEYHRRQKPSKLDPYKPYLLERLREFPELSAKRLFDEIRAQGYEGKISILKDFTREHRVPRKRTVVRFETPPGEQAQCDYAELGLHEVRGVPTKVYAFTMLLGFSRYLYTSSSRTRVPQTPSSPPTPAPSPTSAGCPVACSTTMRKSWPSNTHAPS
ncbi:MAG: helix-turn-helix domain-containing protein [Anaerosomatales bacterium]|nr:helix-turn-helix domain-containing protein [Anaerosomatales bacterium]